MGVLIDVEKILNDKKEIIDKHQNLFRLNEMIKEKREKGIIPKKDVILPTLQDMERHNYNILSKKI